MNCLIKPLSLGCLDSRLRGKDIERGCFQSYNEFQRPA
jgi:hypothetical protein